jgi:hypothetical protein
MLCFIGKKSRSITDWISCCCPLIDPPKRGTFIVGWCKFVVENINFRCKDFVVTVHILHNRKSGVSEIQKKINQFSPRSHLAVCSAEPNSFIKRMPWLCHANRTMGSIERDGDINGIILHLLRIIKKPRAVCFRNKR